MRAWSSEIRAFFCRFFSRQRFRILFSNATEFLSTSRYSASIRTLSFYTPGPHPPRPQVSNNLNLRGTSLASTVSLGLSSAR